MAVVNPQARFATVVSWYVAAVDLKARSSDSRVVSEHFCFILSFIKIV
jgi:hypothetical protein